MVVLCILSKHSNFVGNISNEVKKKTVLFFSIDSIS